MNEILDFVTGIPGDIWKVLPALGLPTWIGWLPKLLTGLGGLTAISRLIPDKWLYLPITKFFHGIALPVSMTLYALGKTVSKTGKKVLGKKWEKVEKEVFEKGILVLFRAVVDGLGIFFQVIRNGLLDGLDADDPGKQASSRRA